MQTNLTKKQILKALPSVSAIFVTLCMTNHDEQTIKITKAQFKQLVEGFESDEILSRVTLFTNNHGTYISI